jgi:phytoene synthase
MTDLQANLKLNAEQLTQKSGSSFSVSFFFLPKQKRRAIRSIYAFCRHSDDIADQEVSSTEKRQQLDAWRKELDLCYSGEPSIPIMKDLKECVLKYNIPKEYFEQLILGVEMDLENNRYQTFDDLYLYCYRVASIVGLMCIEVFEYTDPETKKYAEYLGIALQLTNILRDVGDDAAMDRIYIPLEDLKNFEVEEQDILNKKYTPQFSNLAANYAKRAEDYYQKASYSLPTEDRKNMLAAQMMGQVYHSVLERIQTNEFQVFEGRISLSKFQKLLIGFQVWLGLK